VTPSEAFVLCSTIAFTALIIWWMRTVPDQVLWLRGLLKSRGEALVDDGEVFDTQPRDAWDRHTRDAVLLTHEVAADDEFEDVAAEHFVEWEAECANLRRLAAKLGERAR
jgi:hypothetical protein